MSRTVSCLGALALAAGCGYTDAGEGSKTLEVVVNTIFHANDNRTDVEATVTRQGQGVSGAEIELTEDGSDDGVLLEDQGSEGRYRKEDLTGYLRKVALRVERGDDWLECKLEGPGPHTIVEPANAITLPRRSIGDTLTVRWRVDDGLRADEVRIEVGALETTLDDDDGRYEVAAPQLRAGADTLEVRRANTVVPAGGVGSSMFRIAYAAANDLTVVD